MLVANGAGRTDVGSPIGHLRCSRTKSLLCGVRSEMSAHSRRNVEVNWAEVRSEVEDALQRCGLFALPVRIDGTLKPLGAGLNHENFLFRLNTDGRLPHPDETIYVLRRLRRDSADAPYDELVERLRCEARTLQTLASPQLDFAAPQFVCFVGGCKEAPHGFIETALSGLPCEHIVRDQSKGEVLIELIARSAAAVHRLPVDGFCFLTRHADNRDHLLTELDVVSTPFISEESDARACIEWIRGHLPNRRPSVFLHGDLLPQNLLWDFEKGRLSILDWEFAQIGGSRLRSGDRHAREPQTLRTCEWANETCRCLSSSWRNRGYENRRDVPRIDYGAALVRPSDPVRAGGTASRASAGILPHSATGDPWPGRRTDARKVSRAKRMAVTPLRCILKREQ